MTVSREVVNKYLTEVKNAIKGDRYRIDMNSNRQANIDLFTDYIIDEADAKQLLLGLEVNDFSEVRQNDHVGYEHEMLFIFGKDVLLTERFGSAAIYQVQQAGKQVCDSDFISRTEISTVILF